MGVEIARLRLGFSTKTWRIAPHKIQHTRPRFSYYLVKQHFLRLGTLSAIPFASVVGWSAAPLKQGISS
jgi:hypothetical protein